MINNVTFNQDYSCISLSTDEYHKIFNCEPFGEFYNENTSTFFLKILFSTSLTIIIPKVKDNRLLKIYNLKQKLKICELIFPSNIIDVKINKKRLIVVLKIGQIYIYDLSCVRLIKLIEIKKNDEFVGDLSNDDKSLLVIPLNVINEQTDLFKQVDFQSLIKFDEPIDQSQLSSPGWLLIYDTINLKPKLIFKSHNSNLRKISISNLLIATSSVKGTIIRVHHLQFTSNDDLNLIKIQNLRRGHNMANINSLNFNVDNSVLGCGSENSTIHFFRINEPIEQALKSGSESYNTSNQNEERSSKHNDDDDEDHHDSMNASIGDNEDGTSSKSSEDLNENLVNLLISKPKDSGDSNEDYDHDNDNENNDTGYLSMINKKLRKSPYTKKIIKKLPYKNYLNNLILEPPRRSYAYIKLKESIPNKVVIGFADDLILIVSYSTGKFYQYKFSGQEDQKQCILVNTYDLLNT